MSEAKKEKSPREIAFDKAIDLFRRGKIKGTIRKLRKHGITELEFADRLDLLRDWRRQDKGDEAITSLDSLLKMSDTEETNNLLSDKGIAERRILLEIDGESEDDAELDEYGLTESEHYGRLLGAKLLLAVKGLERLIPVLEQIAQNKNDREASIRHLSKITNKKWPVAKTMYFVGRSELVEFFSSSKIKGATEVDGE